MEKTSIKSPSLLWAPVWSLGLAMFSMFFGAGNIVFPLTIGQVAQGHALFAFLGMALTAILVPFSGLFAMTLFGGDYRAFFAKMGKLPGLFMVLFILALIGPFGAIPRCITTSYATLDVSMHLQKLGISLPLFSVLNGIALFLLSIRTSRMLSILGKILTPVLLLSLALLVGIGFYSMPTLSLPATSGGTLFVQGLVEGYQTMDLLGAFFFAPVILAALRKQGGGSTNRTFFRGSVIAAALLGLVYLSFTYLSAGYSTTLGGVSPKELLGTMATLFLGPYAGVVVSIAVLFACLTTEIALATLFAEFLADSFKKVSYPVALGGTLCVAGLFAMLQFEGITALLIPTLIVTYPALIVLTLSNILHKLYNWKYVKTPVYLTLAGSLCHYLHGKNLLFF